MGETPMPPQNPLPFWVKTRRWEGEVFIIDNVEFLPSPLGASPEFVKRFTEI